MARTFNYRLVKASWAVAIDITADSSFPRAIPDNAVHINERLCLTIVPQWLSEEERRYLRIGLSIVAASILASKPGVEYILVRVLDVDFNPCHYQVEGFAAAIVGWAAQEFAFEAPEMPVVLDRGRKRYIYTFRDSFQPAPPSSSSE